MGMVIVISTACLSGLVMYAYYSKCDPLLQGKLFRAEQVWAEFSAHLFSFLY